LPAMAFHAVTNISYFTMDIPAEAERLINVLVGLVALLLLLQLPKPLVTISLGS
jgi:hypothetical protein